MVPLTFRKDGKLPAHKRSPHNLLMPIKLQFPVWGARVAYSDVQAASTAQTHLSSSAEM
jgi:hypothetical protein